MQQPIHNLASLFAQLGLENSEQAIDTFIRNHSLPNGKAVYEAGFWTEGQRNFLQEAIVEDADWAEVVDELSALLGG